jgi:hypothetical protein
MRKGYFVVALGLVVLTVAIVTVAFRDTDGCHGWSWWTTWWWGSRTAWFPPYVVLAALSLAGGTYCFARAVPTRNKVALVWAGCVLVLGGLGIWFLALADGLSACPP